MKKILFAALSLLALVSCEALREEFQPVFTLKYQNPPAQKCYASEAEFLSDPEFPRTGYVKKTIAELASSYVFPTSEELSGDQLTNRVAQLRIRERWYIMGRVSTTDQPGNLYKTLYIQDETGGIELKIGKNGLYNDYPQGMLLYVDCRGLSLGMYGYKAGNYGGNGMLSLGYSDPSGEYETSYMESSLIIDNHIFKGSPDDLAVPAPVDVTSASDLPDGKTDLQGTNHLIGKLITAHGLKYASQVFCLMYLDSNLNKKESSNRVFLADTQKGITTLAMSKNKMTKYLYSGIWDDTKIGNTGSYVKYDSGKEKTVTDLTHSYFIPAETVRSLKAAQNYFLDQERIPFRMAGNKQVYLVDPEVARSYIADNNWFIDPDDNPYCLTYDADGQLLYPGIEKAAYSVSQYFTITAPTGATGAVIQVRTSGFSKFADYEIPADILNGSRKVDVTGVLTLYQGSIQMTVNSAADFVYSDTGAPVFE